MNGNVVMVDVVVARDVRNFSFGLVADDDGMVLRNVNAT
jgi:hypothetical protein